jgi:hypothetical protein
MWRADHWCDAQTQQEPEKGRGKLPLGFDCRPTVGPDPGSLDRGFHACVKYRRWLLTPSAHGNWCGHDCRAPSRSQHRRHSRISTTCCCEPLGSAGTEDASFCINLEVERADRAAPALLDGARCGSESDHVCFSLRLLQDTWETGCAVAKNTPISRSDQSGPPHESDTATSAPSHGSNLSLGQGGIGSIPDVVCAGRVSVRDRQSIARYTFPA